MSLDCLKKTLALCLCAVTVLAAPIAGFAGEEKTGSVLNEPGHFCLDELALAADSDIFASARLKRPGKADASKETAIREARRCFKEACLNGDASEEESGLGASAWFFYHDYFNAGVEPVWMVYLFRGESLAARVLLSFDASLIAMNDGTEKIESGWSYNGEVDENRDAVQDFCELPVEEKAALYQKWKPVVEEVMRKNPYYAARRNDFYLLTMHPHGVPCADDVTREEAKEIAQKAIVELGADPATVDTRSVEYVFDVTRPDKPEWRVFFGLAEHEINDQALTASQRVRTWSNYRVFLDAKTGEVLDAFIITADMPVWEHRF